MFIFTPGHDRLNSRLPTSLRMDTDLLMHNTALFTDVISCQMSQYFNKNANDLFQEMLKNVRIFLKSLPLSQKNVVNLNRSVNHRRLAE